MAVTGFRPTARRTCGSWIKLLMNSDLPLLNPPTIPTIVRSRMSGKPTSNASSCSIDCSRVTALASAASDDSPSAKAM